MADDGSTTKSLPVFKRVRIRKCRCSLRNITEKEAEDKKCPGRVYGFGATIGQCQANAKATAPQVCRKYYGHCGWTK